MSASGIQAGRAYVELELKNSKFKQGLAQAEGFVKQFSGMLSAGGPVGQALTAFTATAGAALAGLATGASAAVLKFSEVGSQINDVAARTGLATAQLQHLKYAAEQSGASLEDVEKAAIGLAKNGLSLADFERLGQHIAAIEDPSQRTAAALETFGKSGAKLLPLFADWNNLKAASAAAGAILTEDEVARADALGDAFGAMKESASRLTQQVGAVLAPALQNCLEIAIGFTAQLADSVKLISTVASIAAKKTTDRTKSFVNSPFVQALPGGLGTAATAASLLGGAMPSGQFISDAQARGHRAVAGVGAANRAKAAQSASQAEEGGGGKAAVNPIEKARLEHEKAVNAEFERRQHLIRSFETPHEAFLRREQEIKTAIQQTIQAGHSFVLPFDVARQQLAGLQTALGRLRQQEVERQQREGGKAGPERAAKALAEERERQERPERPRWAEDIVARANDTKALVSFSGASLAMATQLGSSGPSAQQLAAAKEALRKYDQMLEHLETIANSQGGNRAA